MMAQAFRERGAKQAPAEEAAAPVEQATRWGNPAEMSMEKIESVILEMSEPGLSDFQFRGSLRDFMMVVDELRIRCIEEGATEDEYLMNHTGNMSNALEQILDHHPVGDFNSEDEMRRIARTKDALLGLRNAERVVVGGQPGAAEPELRLPEIPEPVPVSVAGPGDFVIEFNPEWWGLFASLDARNLNAQLAAEAGFYDLIGDRAAAAHFGQRWLQDTVDNINNWRHVEQEGGRVPPGSDLTLEDLRTGNWGDDRTRDFILARFGMAESQMGSALEMLNFISQGNILEALRSAPRNTTFAYTLASVVAGTLSNVEMRIPLMTMQVDSTVNVYENDVLFINAIAFAELVLSQKYEISATQLPDQRWSLDFSPKGDLDPLGGGGAGGELGFYAGEESRYVSLSVMGEWDANLQQAIGTATVKFVDASGNPFGIPMDGKVYTAMLASIDTNGMVHASGTIQVAPVQNNEFALMISFGGAYGTDISDASQQWLARIGTRDYWTLMPGATFEIRHIGEIDTGLERISAGVHGIFDPTGAQMGVMGTVDFYGGDWNVGLEGGWRRIQVLPDMGDLIIGEDQTIDTGQFGLRVRF